MNSVEALDLVGAELLAGKVLLDVANALDFTTGSPKLAAVDGPSLAETIQARLPDARVVKSLNTMNANVMVEPGLVANGDHTVFVCGDDEGARGKVRGLVGELGSIDVIDFDPLTDGGGIGTGLERLALPVELVVAIFELLAGAGQAVPPGSTTRRVA